MMKQTTFIRLILATCFFGSIGLGTWMGMGDLERLDTVGDWVAVIGAGGSGFIYVGIQIYKSLRTKEEVKN